MKLDAKEEDKNWPGNDERFRVTSMARRKIQTIWGHSKQDEHPVQ